MPGSMRNKFCRDILYPIHVAARYARVSEAFIAECEREEQAIEKEAEIIYFAEPARLQPWTRTARKQLR